MIPAHHPRFATNRSNRNPRPRNKNDNIAATAHVDILTKFDPAIREWGYAFRVRFQAMLVDSRTKYYAGQMPDGFPHGEIS